MLGAILGGLFMGRLSDGWGRRRAMMLAFVGAILVIPLWALPQRLALLATGAFALQFMVQGAWGVIPAHICELSPDSIRGFMPGFAYQCGNLVASYITVQEAHNAAQWGYARTLMISALVIFILALVVTGLGRERGGVKFADGL
jgi:SHS family lactate transporter-like MFS transporter